MSELQGRCSLIPVFMMLRYTACSMLLFTSVKPHFPLNYLPLKVASSVSSEQERSYGMLK